MRELEKKHKFKRRLYSVPSLLLLIFVTILLIRGAWEIVSKMQDSRGYVNRMQEEIDILNKREGELSQATANLGTEEGIKREIKEKFSVSEEGEYLAVIIDPKSTSTINNKKKESWFRRFWNVIIGR